MRCNWRECDFSAPPEDFGDFRSHVYAHVQQQLDKRCSNAPETASEASEECITCGWSDCDAQFGMANGKAEEERWTAAASQLAMHTSIHIYHARLMAIGESHAQQERGRAKVPLECKLPKSDRRIFALLQRAGVYNTELVAFHCGWQDCVFETRSVSTYFSHVASHADNEASSEGQSSSRRSGKLACGWRDCVGGEGAQAGRSRTFANAHRLAEHLRTHTAERVAACSRCGAVFSSLTKLRDHLYAQVRAQGAEASGFGCSVCSKRFATERLLRDHIRKHLNMFKCARCGLTCTSSSAVRRHIEAVHARRGGPASDCESVTSSLPELSDSGSDSDSASVSAASSAKRRKRVGAKAGSERRVFECHLCAPHAPAAAPAGKCQRGPDGRFVGREPGQFRFVRGAQLTQHLMVAHAIDYPTGHRRFRYSRDADGVYRLSAVRYETELLTTVDLDASGHATLVQPRSPTSSASAAPGQPQPANDDNDDEDEDEDEESDRSLSDSASQDFSQDPASVGVRDPFRLDFDEVASQITFTYDESEYD